MGILVNTGFDVGSSDPIDSRTVKNTTDERDALVTDGLVYENLKVYCKDTQTEYRWTGTDWEEVGTGGTVDLSGYAKTYTSLDALGLTAPVTVGEIFNAMPNKTTAVISCEAKDESVGTVTVSDIPESYGILTIKKNGVGRLSIEYQNSSYNTACNVKKWIGTLKGADGTGLYWKQLSAEPTFTTLSDIGLTADATFQDVINALPKGGSALLGVKNFTNYQTIFPYEEVNDQFARVHIVKGIEDGSNVYARWFRKDGVKEAIANFNINDNKFSGWRKLQTCNTKTLVTNTTTLKLDVTKRNSAWYGAIKLTYLYDTSPAEIEISFKNAAEGLRWAVISGQKYVNSITFTQDSSNTAHYTIGIQFAGTTYGCYQAEVIGDFADINSLTSEAFTGEKTAVYYSPWGKNNGVTLVSAPGDIGLTFPCTTVQLVQAMWSKFHTPNNTGTIGVFNCSGKADTITDAPSDYGLLHIETFGYNRISIRFDGIDNSTYAYTGSWIGQLESNNSTFSITWERTDNNYSTTEQAVGTWIDGSTVYRKVFIIDSVDAQTTEAAVKICDVGFNTQHKIINLSGTVNSIGNDGLLPYAYYPSSFQFFSYVDSRSVYFKGTWKYPLNNVRIILEYIK